MEILTLWGKCIIWWSWKNAIDLKDEESYFLMINEKGKFRNNIKRTRWKIITIIIKNNWKGKCLSIIEDKETNYSKKEWWNDQQSKWKSGIQNKESDDTKFVSNKGRIEEVMKKGIIVLERKRNICSHYFKNSSK
jgi:hypothetical protein